MASLVWTQHLVAADNQKKNNFLQAITIQISSTSIEFTAQYYIKTVAQRHIFLETHETLLDNALQTN
jgi:hypothetical protein